MPCRKRYSVLIREHRLLCVRFKISIVCVCLCVRMRQIYCDWANHYLTKVGHCERLVNDLQTDLCDGVLLADIIQSVST